MRPALASKGVESSAFDSKYFYSHEISLIVLQSVRLGNHRLLANTKSIYRAKKNAFGHDTV